MNLGVTLIGSTAEYTDPIGLTTLILDIKSTSNLKRPTCASKQDELVLVTIRYV